MGDKIRLVDGAEVREELLSGDDVTIYDYELNKPVAGLALVVGTALAGLAGAVWWTSGLPDASWIFVFALLALGALGFWGLVGYWYRYAAGRFVAVSPQRLFVGEGDQMWSIDWSLVDRQAVGFDEMSVTSLGGKLDLDVAGQHVELRLYNTFVRLEDIQGPMLRLLESVRDESETNGESTDGSETTTDSEESGATADEEAAEKEGASRADSSTSEGDSTEGDSEDDDPAEGNAEEEDAAQGDSEDDEADAASREDS